MLVRRRVVRLGSLALVAAVVAGCGGGEAGSDDGTAAAEGDAAADEGGSSDEPLVFAAVPVDETEELEQAFAPLVDKIASDLGREVSFEPVASNAGVIEAQIAERVDIAVYGAFSYHLASSRADVTAIAGPVRAPDVAPSAIGYGVVRADSDIESLEDLAGTDICFTDPGSTTGYLQPSASLLDAGVDPETDANAIFAGGHDTAVTSLLAGDCDAAFVGDVFINQLLPARGVLDPDDIRRIYETPELPPPPVVVGNWLDEQTVEAIQSSITELNALEMAEQGMCEGNTYEAPEPWGEDHAGEPACPMGASNAFRFVELDDAAFEPIRAICETTQADVCQGGD